MTNAVTKTAEIIPHISLMKKMASISGTIPSRIMELVDNSVDAKLPNQRLKIEINFDSKNKQSWLEIKDNGCGMTEEIAQNFFKLGNSDKAGQQKIGRFGIGAKVAIIGLGDTCEITTTPINEDYSIHLKFDIRKFKDWSVEYSVQNKGNKSHGTRIMIKNVTVRMGNLERFKERLYEHIAKTYKHFIETNEIEIRINGEKVVATDLELLPEYHQEFDFEVNGKRVYGWAGAMKEAGKNWKFGFDLISNGRIIKANDFLSRQAHTSLARLVGEIHLNDFATDVHKTEFLRDKEEFQLMQDTLLNDVLADLISRITRLTNRDVFNKYQKDIHSISRKLNQIIRNEDFFKNLDMDENIFAPIQRIVRAAKVEERNTIREVNNDLVQEDKPEREPKKREPKKHGGFIIDEPINVYLGENNVAKNWSSFEKEDGLHLQVELNLDHPLYQKEDIGIMVQNMVVESIAEFILGEEKKQTELLENEIGRLNKIKDVLIRHIL